MKKSILFHIALLLLIAANGLAQTSTNLIVSPTPASSLSLWSLQKQTVVYLVTGNSAIQSEYKIKTEIQLTDGTVVGKTDLTRSRVYILKSGNTIYYADDVVPLDYMIFTGKYRVSLNTSGKLPSETYQICVSLVNTQDFAPIAPSKCKVFTIATPQLPVLIRPFKDQVLNETEAQSVITFKWTPLAPITQSIITYKVLVFEVLQGQTPMQALRSNMPILDQDVRSVTQYVWNPQGILNQNPADENGVVHQKKLIWTIQTYDNQNEQPFLDGGLTRDGLSEPVVFYVGTLKK
ncbi:hypothetical protein [Flavobacterium muglaense]|uniref:Uncharacterized protein n=1 Tax=Flavobacterium muglaense TaxID=2764716 RepID=A0A923MYE2_9FLAO|nr:hypothetical protein [Flavobacterium muglaense]MBC5837542.1 hypothetical protein [Flavobacterium muglaense]MBC5844041.1 hypothetical protein [Flavobacterium muglaense]